MSKQQDQSETPLEIGTAIRTQRTAVLMLVTLVIAVFGSSITFDFVNWDDPWYVLNNDLIASWSFSNLYGIATETVTRNYAPVTIFSFLLDRTVWGYWPGGYHLTNMLLHVVNSILVFLLLKQVTQRYSIALFTACLFAIHPVQVESVVWISARKGLLSASFILISLMYWLRKERTARDELWGTFWYIFALLSKALGIIVPGIVFVYDVLIRKKTVAEAISRGFVGFLLAFWLILTTAGSQQSIGGGIRHHFVLNKIQMLAVDATLLWKYIAQLLWPAQLSILYDPPIFGISTLITISVLGWVAVGLLMWKIKKRAPLCVFATACFFAPLVPVLNLFPITTIMNDRYLYLACIPFFAASIAVLEASLKTGFATAGACCLYLQKRTVSDYFKKSSNQYAQLVLLSGLSVAIMLSASRTSSYLEVWKNDTSLWENAVEQTPKLPLVHYQYALALWRLGDQQQAISELELTLTLDRIDEYDRSRFEEKLKLYRKMQDENSIAKRL